MKLHILVCLLVLLGTCLELQQTSIIFLTQFEDQQEEDYIQLGLTVSAEGTSLVKVMNDALKIAEEIKKIAIQFCHAHSKKKSECKEIVDIGKYDINPKYQVVKRESKFIGFQVEHEVKIKVFAVDFISDLADVILKQRNTKIVSFDWKPLQEVNKQEAAVKQGTQQGQQLCEQIGMHLSSIENVEQMNQSATEQTAVYKFSIKCSKTPKEVQDIDKQMQENVDEGDKKEQVKDIKNQQAKQSKKEPVKGVKKEKKEKKASQNKNQKAEEKKTKSPKQNEEL